MTILDRPRTDRPAHRVAGNRGATTRTIPAGPPQDPAAPPIYLIPTLLGALAVLAGTLAIPPMIVGKSWVWRDRRSGAGDLAGRSRCPVGAGAGCRRHDPADCGGRGRADRAFHRRRHRRGDPERRRLQRGRRPVDRCLGPDPNKCVARAFLHRAVVLDLSSVGATALIVDILIAICRAPALVALPLLCVYLGARVDGSARCCPGRRSPRRQCCMRCC